MKARKPTAAEWEREGILRERWIQGEFGSADNEMKEWLALQEPIRQRRLQPTFLRWLRYGSMKRRIERAEGRNRQLDEEGFKLAQIHAQEAKRAAARREREQRIAGQSEGQTSDDTP